jgi:hypothetical protein
VNGRGVTLPAMTLLEGGLCRSSSWTGSYIRRPDGYRARRFTPPSTPSSRRCRYGLSCSQRLKYQYTVCHGGKSTGSCRHAHPVRTTYKIASTIARRGCFSGQPPKLTCGSSGSITTNCSSLVSEGYRCGRRAIEPQLITSELRSRRHAAPSQTRSEAAVRAHGRASGAYTALHWMWREFVDNRPAKALSYPAEPHTLAISSNRPTNAAARDRLSTIRAGIPGSRTPAFDRSVCGGIDPPQRGSKCARQPWLVTADRGELLP